MKIKYGSYRKVFIFNKFVIKIPINFNGWLCNINEIYNWYKYKEHRDIICPIILHDILGLLIIMSKANPITKEQYKSYDKRGSKFYNKFYENNFRHPIIQDMNENNLGVYKNKIVKIDYGNYWWIKNLFVNLKSFRKL